MMKHIRTEVMLQEARQWQWHPTPVLLPGKSHGQRSLVGCSPWGREESDTTERLPFYFSLSCKASQLSFAVLWDGLWWTVCRYEIRGCVIGGSVLSPPGSGDQVSPVTEERDLRGRSLEGLWTASFIPRWGTRCLDIAYVNFGWEIFVMRGREFNWL